MMGLRSGFELSQERPVVRYATKLTEKQIVRTRKKVTKIKR